MIFNNQTVYLIALRSNCFHAIRLGEQINDVSFVLQVKEQKITNLDQFHLSVFAIK